MRRLTKYTKNKLRIKLVFIYKVLKLHSQADGQTHSLKSVLFISSVKA